MADVVSSLDLIDEVGLSIAMGDKLADSSYMKYLLTGGGYIT